MFPMVSMSGRCLASEDSLYLEKTVRVRPGYRGYAPHRLHSEHYYTPVLRVRFLVSSTTTSPHGPTRFKARLYAPHRTAVPSRGRDEHVARSHDFIHLHSTALLSLLSRVYSLKSSPRLEDARQIGLSARREDRLHVLKLIAGSCLSCSRRAHGVRVIGVLALGGSSACDTRGSAFFEDVLAFWKTSGRAQEHDLAYRRRPLLNGRFEDAAGFRRLPYMYCIFFTSCYVLRCTFVSLETRIAALTTERSISRSARASRISSRKP